MEASPVWFSGTNAGGVAARKTDVCFGFQCVNYYSRYAFPISPLSIDRALLRVRVALLFSQSNQLNLVTHGPVSSFFPHSQRSGELTNDPRMVHPVALIPSQTLAPFCFLPYHNTIWLLVPRLFRSSYLRTHIPEKPTLDHQVFQKSTVSRSFHGRVRVTSKSSHEKAVVSHLADRRSDFGRTSCTPFSESFSSR
jgi:hypothetical protein